MINIFLDVAVLLQFPCKSSAFLNLPGPATATLSSQHDAATMIHGGDVLFVPNGAQRTCSFRPLVEQFHFGFTFFYLTYGVSQSSGDFIPHEAFIGEETSHYLLEADFLTEIHPSQSSDMSLGGLPHWSHSCGPLTCICTYIFLFQLADWGN